MMQVVMWSLFQQGAVDQAMVEWLVETIQDIRGQDKNPRHRRQPNMQPCRRSSVLGATEALAARVNSVDKGGSERPTDGDLMKTSLVLLHDPIL
ncbi:uncharacterized protein ACO6RY_17845 [Pungitius sinensis]